MAIKRSYDIIGFGDEVPGVLALVSAAREYRRQTSRYPSVLLMSKAPENKGIGGHLVRGGLAYLDRSQIPSELRENNNLDTFGSPSTIYQEFLQKSDVRSIALDPDKANEALQELRRTAGVDLLTNVAIDSVLKEGQKITGLQLARGEIYLAKQFIDATVNAELAQAAGTRKNQGFETFGLPGSELPVTLVFETEGLSAAKLRQIEDIYLRRFTNPNDVEAQAWLQVAAGGDNNLAEQLRQDLKDNMGKLKQFSEGEDYIDVRSLALSISYHSFRGKKFSLTESGFLLDKANIAKLSDERLVWNALLLDVNASEAEILAQEKSMPTAAMLEEMAFIEQWLQSLGATEVRPADELYIRHAGNVTNVVDPLTGAEILNGGVPANEALGTFGYHFDNRGGIKGLAASAAANGFSSLNFERPIFNIGIQHALIQDIPNLAVVSPASGFEGLATSAGRIVEHNVAVGQGAGIAATIALLDNRNIADISNIEVRHVLEETEQLPTVFGISNSDFTRLNEFEIALTNDETGNMDNTNLNLLSFEDLSSL